MSDVRYHVQECRCREYQKRPDARCVERDAEVASLRAALAWLNDWLESGRTDEGEAHAMMNSVRAALAGRGPEARGEPTSLGEDRFPGETGPSKRRDAAEARGTGASVPGSPSFAKPRPDAPPATYLAVMEQGARIPDVRGLLEAVDAVLNDPGTNPTDEHVIALAAKRKEWP